MKLDCIFMNEKEQEERAKVVKEALSWQKTPYRHMARVKGAGADCLTFMACVFENCGLIEKIEIPFYSKDWMNHRSAERYVEGLLQYTKEISTPPLPGDIIVWKVGRCFSHGALVIDYPRIIHAQAGVGVMQENAENAAWLTHEKNGETRQRRVFSYWGK